MKLSCEIVQDLLALYDDGICSEESKAAVEDHLKECSACQRLLSEMHRFEEPEYPAQAEAENRAVVRSFRKIRRRWAISLIATLLIVPVLFLTINQIRQEGVCYTNIDEIVIAGSYLRELADQDWEAASAQIDYEKKYHEIQALLGMTAEDFLPHFTPATIGQREWMAEDSFYQRDLQDLEDGDLFWDYAVFNYAYPLIPLEGWERIKTEMPESIVMDGEDEVAISEGLGRICYRRMETKWGTFMVEQSSPLWECTSAYEFCSMLALVPKEIYEEAATDFEAAAQEQYEYLQEHFASVADLSLEDYCESRRNSYIQGLMECAEDGFIFENPRYERSEYIYTDGIGCWKITYGVDVLCKGKSNTFQLSLTISKGKIISISPSWPTEFLSEALSF